MVMKETHDEGLGWPRCVRACVREGQKLREIKLILMMMRMVMENVVGFIEPHMNARGHQLHLLKGRLKPPRPRDTYGLVGTRSSSSSTIYIYIIVKQKYIYPLNST